MPREIQFDWKNGNFRIDRQSFNLGDPTKIASRLLISGHKELYGPFFDQSERPIPTELNKQRLTQIFGDNSRYFEVMFNYAIGLYPGEPERALDWISDVHSLEFLELLAEKSPQSIVHGRSVITSYLALRSEVDQKRLIYERELQQSATRDSLTGLLNRRTAEELMLSSMALAQRQELPVAIGMFDLDKFKILNDTYGHPAGDEVLKSFAGSLERHFRGYDVVARFGGEEFVVLAYGIPKEVLEKRLSGLSRDHFARSTKLGTPSTYSSGWVHGEHYEDLEDHLKTADKLLYVVKESDGRDGARIRDDEDTILRFGNI